MAEQAQKGTEQSEQNPELNPQDFVAISEFPECPECGEKERPVIANGEGLQGLHCGNCLRILRYIEPVTRAIDREDRHYAAVGDKAYGTGETKEEAVEKMKEHLGDDPFPAYTLYVSNQPIQVSRYGSVMAEEGNQVFLHNLGKQRLRDYGDE